MYIPWIFHNSEKIILKNFWLFCKVASEEMGQIISRRWLDKTVKVDRKRSEREQYKQVCMGTSCQILFTDIFKQYVT